MSGNSWKICFFSELFYSNWYSGHGKCTFDYSPYKAETFSFKVGKRWNKCLYTKKKLHKETPLVAENAHLATRLKVLNTSLFFFRSGSDIEKTTIFSFAYFLPLFCCWKQRMEFWLPCWKNFSQKAKNMAQ